MHPALVRQSAPARLQRRVDPQWRIGCIFLTLERLRVSVSLSSTRGSALMATTADQTHFTKRLSHRAGRRFFVGMALVIIATSIVGFPPAIVDPATRRALCVLHVAVALPGSSLLIANRRVALHRRLGLTSLVLLALMIPLGFTTTTAMVRRRFDLSGDQHVDPHPDGRTAQDAPTASVFNFAAFADVHHSRHCGNWLSSPARRLQVAHAVCEYLAHGCADSARSRSHTGPLTIAGIVCNSLYFVPRGAGRL